MAAAPFKVKALYDYNSGHEDDLAFPEAAIITVTAEEDADWYVGEYNDPNGTKREGLFPKNFVERYEPAPPPRPNRASRPPPPPSAPAPLEEPPVDDVPEQPEPEQQPPVARAPAQPEAPREERPVPPQSPPPVTAPKSPEQPPLPKMTKPAPPPAAPAAGSKSPPPPVAEKPQSFKDRIAAFNRGSAAPIAPIKPSGAPTGFIKKPFVAPPPSRNAYVPPPREAAPQKVYKREEDPDISERQAQDQDMADKAGLGGSSAPAEGEEDAPKPQSLKERIALLQRQQMEQAARQAETSHKEKPKRPPKKRIESHEKDIQSETTEGGEPDDAQAQAKRRHSHHPKSPEARLQEREPFSDGNEADQSAAGETTEDAEGSSTTVEEDEEQARAKTVPRAHAAPTQEPEVGDEEDATEEDEAEDEMDEEAKRRMELRERMAKLSGGMGMAGMFGMPMPGMKPPVKKTTPGPERKSIDSHRDSEQSPPPAQRVPMVPIPGMGMPQVRSPESEDTEMAVEKEHEPAHPISGEHEPEEVPDVEDIKADEPVKDHPQEKDTPPALPQDRPVPPPPSADRPVPPLVPAESRPVLAPPPERPESRESESDDELPARGAPPPIPQSPPQHRGEEPNSPSVASRPSTSSEKRASRPIPPIPGVSSPIMSPTAVSRALPPPPPATAPPSRGSAKEALSPHLGSREDMEGETEYEGDYDTDIASGATHKDALKAHTRDQSYDETTLAGSPITGPPPVPSGAPRAVPPPPPQQPPPSRQSIDAPRGAPPPPPRESMDAPRAMPPPLPRESIDAPRAMPPLPPRESLDAPRAAPPPLPSQPMSPTEDDEYDPYRPNAQAARAAPPPPSGLPPAAEPAGPVSEEDDDEEIYQSPPPRRMSKRTSQHPVTFPPHQEAEDTYETPMSPPRSSMQTTRKSLDVDRTLGSRRSMDQSRPSIDHGHIANDVDLGQGSQWWTQPNMPPPVFQNRKDVLFEIEESTTAKRGGRTIVQKDVYVLFQDYSQTIVTARFDTREAINVALEQRHEPPPQKLRQDQLEDAYEQFGRRISADANAKQHATIGDGSPQALILELLKPLSSALYPVGTRAYGALVYANLANASVQQNDEIRPGDIISLRNAKFEGKHGAMHAKYKMEVGKPDHVGVVVEWDGTKKKIRALEQGRESKKVKVESFRMADLRSGEVRVWRVMGRGWVGWDVSS